MKRTRRSSFSRALRTVRTGRDLRQEAFDDVSSRTYVSALERGIKQPTLPKVDDLADVLGVHPLTLLALSYAAKPTAEEVAKLFAIVSHEVQLLKRTEFDR